MSRRLLLVASAEQQEAVKGDGDGGAHVGEHGDVLTRNREKVLIVAPTHRCKETRIATPLFWCAHQKFQLLSPFLSK